MCTSKDQFQVGDVVNIQNTQTRKCLGEHTITAGKGCVWEVSGENATHFFSKRTLRKQIDSRLKLVKKTKK